MRRFIRFCLTVGLCGLPLLISCIWDRLDDLEDLEFRDSKRRKDNWDRYRQQFEKECPSMSMVHLRRRQRTRTAGESFEWQKHCRLCCEPLKDDEEVRLYKKCGNVYHVGCFDSWFMERLDEKCEACLRPLREHAAFGDAVNRLEL